jgi:UDP:flavonoid glycosyltransferase YjiC (YdhE family)
VAYTRGNNDADEVVVMRPRIVFAPLSNTLSHIADCLAIAEELASHWYEIVFLTSTDKRQLIEAQSYRTIPTREIWQKHGEQEVLAWLDDRATFRDALLDEIAALREIKPDLVIGSYRYTTRLACSRLKVPWFSVIGPNMSPHFKGMLGVPNGCLDERTRSAVVNVYRAKAASLKQAIEWWPDEVRDIRDLLEGDQTFLHALPGFERLDNLPASYSYVGPLSWAGWSRAAADVRFEQESGRHVFVFLGSHIAAMDVLSVLEETLEDSRDEVIVFAPPSQLRAVASRLGRCAFRVVDRVSLDVVLNRCDLAIVHGGLNVLQQALLHGVPCVIFPHQVEQAQNALRAEEIGFGRNALGHRLIDHSGAPETRHIVERFKVVLRYHNEVRRVERSDMADAIREGLADEGWRRRCCDLAAMWRPQLEKAHGVEAIRRAVETTLPS